MASSSSSSSSPMPQQQHETFQQPKSPWHSPVPYLFGGLAAMLGLIAFALLILACSYWKLSGDLDNENDDLEAGKEDDHTEKQQQHVEYEEKILVIMAGDVKPTFLATPVSSGSSSSNSSIIGTSFRKAEKLHDGEKLDGGEIEAGEKLDRVTSDHVH